MRHLFYILVATLVVVACTSQPEGLLSESMMEDVIYDIHLSQSISDQQHNDGYLENETTSRAYREAVYRKYHITEAQWDSSFNYYCKHADVLHDIYENVAERLRNDVIAVGGDVTLSGDADDTLNVWNAESHFVLMQKEPYNLQTFDIKGDSLFKEGEVITLSYNPQFIFQDGSRDLVVLLAVTFGNDSVAVNTRHCSTDGITKVVINDDKYLGIKRVRGYFMLFENTGDANGSTFRMASVYNIRLTHTPGQTPKPQTAPASEKADSTAVKDSLAAKPEPSGAPVDGKPERQPLVEHSLIPPGGGRGRR